MDMLARYYDVLDKDHFESWFGDLYIGQHPTPERNSYLVIRLNFAVVNAELNSYRQALDAHCRNRFEYKILSDTDCLNDYKSENHGTGYLRTFFDTIKGGTQTALKRVFNELTGFAEEEVREMLDYYAEACAGTPGAFHHTTDELIEKISPKTK